MTVASHTGSDPIWRIPMPPRAAVRATIARGLFLRTVRGLRDAPLRVVLPDGAIAAEGRPGAPVMTITRDAFFHRLAARIASSPQPVPISSRLSDGPRSTSRHSASYLRDCAVSSVSPGSNTAAE